MLNSLNMSSMLDAGMQELAKGVGLIKHFPWADVLGAGFSAGMMQTDAVTKAMNTLYPKAGAAAVSASAKLDAIRQLAMYYGAANVSQQLALIAMKQPKSKCLRVVTNGFNFAWFGHEIS